LDWTTTGDGLIPRVNRGPGEEGCSQTAAVMKGILSAEIPVLISDFVMRWEEHVASMR
jgi:hypothetical protein